ncbi:MAG: tyrosine--tRNA ligase [Candidatus Baldrarchaeia archaeon]
MDVEERMYLVTRNTAEVLTEEELRNLLETNERPKGYIGYEPSGIVHLGWLITINKIRDFVKAGFDFTILWADLHAYANEKLGGKLENIQACAKYMEHVFTAFGVRREKVRYLFATDFINEMGATYVETMIRVAKLSTLARIKRTLTILGRKEEEAAMKFSMLIYPPMQAADVFLLDVDVAYGGTDQRNIHVLCRELAPKLGRKKPVAVHTPLLTGLKGARRMDSAKITDERLLDLKMSKSIPESCIFVHDPPDVIRKKIMDAYCPARETQLNPIMEINKYLLFAQEDFTLKIERPAKYGGDVEVHSYKELEEMYTSGQLHPYDLKKATAEAVIELLKPIREYFERNREAAELYNLISRLQVTR